MAFTQVKDILKRAVEFHKTLEGFYSRIENETGKKSVKLLSDYMARHEKVLEALLGQITERQEKQIAEEWIKYPPNFAACLCFEELKVGKDSSVDEVIDAGLTLNQCLIDLYHHTAEIAPTNEIKLLFASLETEEIAEKKKLARMRGM